MTIKQLSALSLLALLPAMSAQADAALYPYQTTANYCPGGMQPVTINGVICCGTPNQATSYQAMMTHPVARKTTRRVASTSVCPEGEKGCHLD